MKRCPNCDWPNTDDADKCCKCRHFLTVEPAPKKDYALKSFLIDNERLFTIMGVFLVIAVFFNNPGLLNFNNPSSNSLSNITIYTECQNKTLEQNCFKNLSPSDHSNITFTNISNSSFKEYCKPPISVLNCTSNVSSNNIGETQSQQVNDIYTKFFSFLSSVLFLLIACVVLLNSFSYIRLYEHSKNPDKKNAILAVLKDLTIFIFIIPFIFLLIYFVILVSSAFGEFFTAGMLIFSVTIYIIEILVVMYSMLRILFGFKGNRRNEFIFGGICLIIGLGSAAFFAIVIPSVINLTLAISMAFLLISGIAFIRPYIEKDNPSLESNP